MGEQRVYKTDYGNVTLDKVNNTLYKVYDAVDDTYRGYIIVKPTEILTDELVNRKIKKNYAECNAMW